MAKDKDKVEEKKVEDEELDEYDEDEEVVDESMIDEDEEYINKDGKVVKIDSGLQQIADEADEAVSNEKKAFKEMSPERIARNKLIAELANSDDVNKQNMAKEYVTNDCMAFVQSFTRYMLSRCATGYIVELDDCVHDVFILVYDSLHKYKPSYSLLTFIKPKIVRAVQEARKINTGLSTHYLQNIKPIEEAIAKFAEKGIANPSEKDIHIETGISMKTIANTRGQMYAANEVRIDGMDYDALDSTIANGESNNAVYTSSPENVLISKEKGSLLLRALNELDEEERNIIINRVLDQYNWNDIARINDSEPENVKQIYSNALKKLRTSRVLDPLRYGDKGNMSRFETHQIATIPYGMAMNLMDDIALLDAEEDGFVPKISTIIE